MIENLSSFVINLPRSRARRERMASQLGAMGLPYQLVEGIDGRAEWERLKDSFDQETFNRNVGRLVMPGEIGLYHTHLRIWENLIDSPFDAALVMEDDVIFHPEFIDALKMAMANIGAWDLLKLNHIRAKQPICQHRAGAWALNAYLGPLTGTGAYLITRDLAKRLLPRMTPITRPFDHELDRSFIHDFRHFGLTPFPSHVDDGNESTITGKAFSGVQKFKWFNRMPLYRLRLRNFIGKVNYLVRKGYLFSPARQRITQFFQLLTR